MPPKKAPGKPQTTSTTAAVSPRRRVTAATKKKPTSDDPDDATSRSDAVALDPSATLLPVIINMSSPPMEADDQVLRPKPRPNEAPQPRGKPMQRTASHTTEIAASLPSTPSTPPQQQSSAAAGVATTNAASPLPAAESAIPSEPAVVRHEFGQWYSMSASPTPVQLLTSREHGDCCAVCTRLIQVGEAVYTDMLLNEGAAFFCCHRRCMPGPDRESPVVITSGCVYHTNQHQHPLVLDETTASDSAFHCGFCEQTGTGERLCCDSCAIVCHTTCLEPFPEQWQFGESLTIAQHDHPLTLIWTSNSIYGNRFGCDVCGKPGHRVFHCTACSWDAHPECLAGVLPLPTQGDTSRSISTQVCSCCKPSAELLALMHRAIVIAIQRSVLTPVPSTAPAGSAVNAEPAADAAATSPSASASVHLPSSGWPFVQDLLEASTVPEHYSGLFGATCLFLLNHCPSRSVERPPGQLDQFALPIYQLCLRWYGGDEPTAQATLRLLLERMWQDSLRVVSVDSQPIRLLLLAVLAPCTALFFLNAPTDSPKHLVQLVPLNYSFRLSDSGYMSLNYPWLIHDFQAYRRKFHSMHTSANVEISRRRSTFLVQFLLEHCAASLQATIVLNTTPLHLAASGLANATIIQALCRFTAQSTEPTNRAVDSAARISAIDAGLAAAADSFSLYPFHYACLSTHGADDVHVLRLLHAAYPTPDETTRTSHPIVMAVHSNLKLSTAAFQFLLHCFPEAVLQTRFDTRRILASRKLVSLSLRMLVTRMSDFKGFDLITDDEVVNGAQPELLLPVQILLLRRSTAISVQLLAVFLDRCPTTILCVDADGRNLLHLAIEHGCELAVLRLLCAREPLLLKQTDYRGYLPLHRLCEQKKVREPVMQLLVDGHPEAVSTATLNRCCDLPLHVLCRDRDFEQHPLSISLFRLLISWFPAGVRAVSDQADSLHTPLHLAIQSRAPFEVLQLLLATDPQAILDCNSDNESPAHMLARCGCAPAPAPHNETHRFDPRCVHLILKANPAALASVETRNGCTPGHLSPINFAQGEILPFFQLSPLPYSTLLVSDARMRLPLHVALGVGTLYASQVAVLLYGRDGEAWESISDEVFGATKADHTATASDSPKAADITADDTSEPLMSKERLVASRVARAHLAASASGAHDTSFAHATQFMKRTLSVVPHSSVDRPSMAGLIAGYPDADGRFPLEVAVASLRRRLGPR